MMSVFYSCLLLFTACSQPVESKKSNNSIQITPTNRVVSLPYIGDSIVTRFPVPDGFSRIDVKPNSFGYYLRNLGLKVVDSPVFLYDGSLKHNQSVHAAVIDLDVGNRDLQQCADAVMRLRAEYLWGQKKYDAIQFHFTNGFLAEYAKWKAGQRIRVTGNNVSWVNSTTASSSYEYFRAYLTMVFAYAGTLSLSKEMTSKSLESITIGDVFIQGGSPGHAVIVVDMARNPETGEQLVLLAQSYMPAQDIHVLKNPSDTGLSPWYPIKEMKGEFRTPEWTFSGGDLKSF